MKGLAFLFPGNLSVRRGMLEGLEDEHPEIRETFEQASELAGEDLWRLSREGPDERLLADPLATLAVVAADVAVYRLLEGMGIAPVALAGYGGGIYAAVVAAGVIPLSTALEMAAEEQRIGWEILGEREFGQLEVLGIEVGRLEDLLGDLVRSEAVCMAALDGPERVVLSGEAGALQDALDRLEETARHVEHLPPSLPRHTPSLLGVPERLNAAFGRLRAEDPGTPLYSSFDGSIVLRGWQAKEMLIKQMIHPLRWDQCVRGLIRNGMDTFVEVGPGSRLSESLQELEPDAHVFVTDAPGAPEHLRETFSTWSF